MNYLHLLFFSKKEENNCVDCKSYFYLHTQEISFDI